MQKIPDRQKSRDDLSDDCGHGGPHHPPFEQENEDRVENDIGSRASEGGGHCKLGVPIRSNHRIQCLSKHIKRDAQADIKEILFGIVEGLLIHRTTEHGDDLRLEQQINSG